MTNSPFSAPKLLLLASAIVAVVAILSYFVIDRAAYPRNPTNSQPAAPAPSNTPDAPHTAKQPEQSRPNRRSPLPPPPP